MLLASHGHDYKIQYPTQLALLYRWNKSIRCTIEEYKKMSPNWFKGQYIGPEMSVLKDDTR